MIRASLLAIGLAVALAFGSAAQAGEVTVVKALAFKTGGAAGTYEWRFDVTLAHADEGWEHYADRFEILNMEGEVIGTRVLHHPHVNEQPFTRSLTSVQLPRDLERVQVRGHDLVHGDGPAIELELPK